MRRTFGGFMSLLLVLAMVLAMVPAVLAADPDPIDVAAVPGEVVELTIPIAVEGVKYYWKAASSNTQVEVPYATTGGTNSVTVSDSITKTTTGLIVYAYATASAADKNLGFGSTSTDIDDRAIYAFRINVTPWTVTLAVDPSVGSFDNTLEPGGTVGLRATVTGPADRITDPDQKVKFKISTEDVASFEGSNSTSYEGGITLLSRTSGYATATVKAGSVTGKFYVTASIEPANGKGAAVSSRYPSNTSSYIEVRTSGADVSADAYIISISGQHDSVKVGDTLTLTATPQRCSGGKYSDVTAENDTIAWSVSDTSIGTLSKSNGSSVVFSAESSGEVTIVAETTIDSNRYTGAVVITITEPDPSSASVTVAPVRGKAGTVVRVPVMLEHNPGFADLSIEIDYNDTVAALTDVQPSEAVGGVFTSAPDHTGKPYVLNWVSGEENNTFNGILAILTFTIKQNAPLGSYPITISYYRGITGDHVDGEDVNYDKDYKRVPLRYISGELTVCSYMPGDINGDDTVDISDAIYLLQYLAGWKLDNVVKEALDVNGDGRINTKDAIQILRYIAGWNVSLY